MTRTADGYLWLATDQGVLRFDGIRFVPWLPPAAEDALAPGSVVKLLAGRDGSLWLAAREGLGRWRAGQLTVYRELAGDFVTALVEDNDGAVWAGTSAGLNGDAKLCRIANDRVNCLTRDHDLGRFVISLFHDGRTLWVGAATGLWRWSDEAPTQYTVDEPKPEIHAAVLSPVDTLLVAMNRGLRELVGDRLERYPVPVSNELKPTALLRDRDGSLWIGTQDQGLLRLQNGRIDRFTRADGLSGDFVTDLLEDVEGNVWVATLNGLDQFRNIAVARIAEEQGLSSATVVSVLASRKNSIWVGTVDGLNRLRDGEVTTFRKTDGLPSQTIGSLAEDAAGRVWISSPSGLAYIQRDRITRVPDATGAHVHAMAGDGANGLWISDQDRGLIRLREGAVTERIPWSVLGNRRGRALAVDPLNGGVWVGFFQGGIGYVKEGALRALYEPADGLGAGMVAHLRTDVAGAVWAATQGGLSRVADNRIATLTTRNGLPCKSMHWSVEDTHDRALWLYTACGLVRVEHSEVDAWIDNPARQVTLRVYSDADGVRSVFDIGSYSPKVSRGPDGRVWFATYDGVGVVDPQRLPFNTVVPPVHVEQITMDGRVHAATPNMQLPPHVRDLRIDYSALSLAAPEDVRFRYKLEGRDADWTDAGNRRRAFYTDLPPGPYRFLVRAANSDGVWNEIGAQWKFTIRPAFYETVLFRGASLVTVAAILWGLYRLRVRRLAAQLTVRFEERLAERTRIAHELHDTLLQGFVSTSMQLHVLADEVAADHPVRPKLGRILQRMSSVIEEGRQAVHGLRADAAAEHHLEHALALATEDLRGARKTISRVVVEGQQRPLHPLIRNEVYRIAREALANAFHHAEPRTIEVEIAYGPRNLRVLVRDDGRGIEPEVLARGRHGHWGIRGMRERAHVIGATLKVRSGVNAGTEVELVVPAHVAFTPASVPDKASSCT